MASEKAGILKFLQEFKEVATSSKRGIDVIPRQKNRDALLNLGITERIRKEIILSLSIDNYCAGPEHDTDRPGFIWEFGVDVDGTEIYVKLKIAEVAGEKIAKCLSFHPAEHPQNYPFRTGGVR